MSSDTLTSARPGAANAGTQGAQIFLEADTPIAQSPATDNQDPLLTLLRDQRGHVWAKVRDVDCLYRVHDEHLDQPVYLAARIAELAHDMYDDDGRPYVHAIRPALERLLIGPDLSFEEWHALVDAAIEGIGGGS